MLYCSEGRGRGVKHVAQTTMSSPTETLISKTIPCHLSLKKLRVISNEIVLVISDENACVLDEITYQIRRNYLSSPKIIYHLRRNLFHSRKNNCAVTLNFEFNNAAANQ